MSTDFSSKEHAFVAELEAETGRDLAAWMTAITQAGLSHRNEIIDWLRPQGFTFARASWIERIHHNGGHLIYASSSKGTSTPEPKRKSKGMASQNLPVVAETPAPKSIARAQTTATEGDIDLLLVSAKAYRPLAQALVRDILAAVPGADARAIGPFIVFTHDAPFAAVAPHAKDVRLWLPVINKATPVDWGPGWQTAKAASNIAALLNLTQMLILTDARQLTQQLRLLIALGAQEVG